jgi:peptidoglycan biosynthesis protein MviN/MurJ (putative lipid II flippase)
MPISIWYGMSSAVLIPTLVKLDGDRRPQRELFLREVLGASVTVAIVSGIFYWLVIHIALTYQLTGLADHVAHLAVHANAGLWMMVPLLMLASLGSSMLMSHQRHENTFFEGLPAFAIIGAMVIFPIATITPLIIGTIAGCALQLVLTFGSVRRVQPLFWPRLSFQSASWVLCMPALGAMFAVSLLQSLASIVDQFFAAGLPQGSLAALGYATRLLALLLTLGSTAVGRAMLPVMADLSRRNARHALSTTYQWAGFAFAAGLITALPFFLFPNFVVKLVYQRGAFDAADTIAVASVLKILIIQVPLSMVTLVFTQLHLAHAQYRHLLAMSAASLALKTCFSYYLATRYGIDGLAASAVLLILFQALFTGATLHRVTKSALEKAKSESS